jgi:hypothetical protein
MIAPLLDAAGTALRAVRLHRQRARFAIAGSRRLSLQVKMLE